MTPIQTSLRNALIDPKRVYFVLTTGFFLFLTTGLIQISQLPALYLALFTLFLFNRSPKLNLNLEWSIYGGVIALVIFLSYIGSQHPEHAIIKTTILRDLALLSFAFYIITMDDLVTYYESFLLAMIIAFLLVTPLTLWEYLYAAKQLPHSTKYFSPELSYYGHIRHFSYHAFIATAFSTILLLNGNRRAHWQYLLCLLCVVALITSTGRAAIASYAIFLIFIGLRLLPITELIKRALVVVALAALVLFLLWLSPASSIVDSIIQRTEFSLDPNTLLSGRVDIWKSGLDAAKSFPVLGMGPDSFVVLHNRLSGTSQPHNVLVQFILDYGWLGTAIILLCVARLLTPILFRKSTRVTESQLPFLLSCFVVAYIIYSLFDGMFYYPLPMLHFFVVIAILVRMTSAPKDAKEPFPYE